MAHHGRQGVGARVPQAAGDWTADAEWRRVNRSQQRYGMLLLALGAAFFFEGVAEPGDLQRAVGTVLIGATLMLALYAAELPTGACASRPRSFSQLCWAW